jgi:hypothetical protein
MKNIVATLICILCIIACSKNKTTTIPGRGLKIEDSLKIRMAEEVDSLKRTLKLTCFTKKQFECSNFYITNTIKITGNVISIHFNEIQSPDICLTAIGPASAVLNFENILNGKYVLEIYINNSKIESQLDVSAASYKITAPTQSSVEFINPVLNRVPTNTIWGKVHYHANSTGILVQKFIDSLQILGATPTTYLPGNYLDFQIDSSGQIKQIQEAGYHFTRHYIFQYNNSSAALKKLVRNFGVTYPDSVSITLNTVKGETFYSWRP